MKLKSTKQMGVDTLARLAKFCAATPGTIVKIVDRLTKLTGANQYRQNVEEYLTTDPARRVEPHFGLGVALLIAGAEFIGPTTIGNPTVESRSRVRAKAATRNGKPKARKPRKAKTARKTRSLTPRRAAK